MSFLTAEQFEELWNERGLQYRLGDFYQVLVGHGLKIKFPNFSSNIKELLRTSLVEGVIGQEPHDMCPDRVRWWDRLKRGEDQQ